MKSVCVCCHVGRNHVKRRYWITIDWAAEGKIRSVVRQIEPTQTCTYTHPHPAHRVGLARSPPHAHAGCHLSRERGEIWTGRGLRKRKRADRVNRTDGGVSHRQPCWAALIWRVKNTDDMGCTLCDLWISPGIPDLTMTLTQPFNERKRTQLSAYEEQHQVYFNQVHFEKNNLHVS